MPLTPLQTMRLKYYERKLGVLTSEEALNRALESDATVSHLGGLDPASDRFYYDRHDHIEYAELLTIQENDNAQAAGQ